MDRYKIDSSARVRLPVKVCASLGVAQGDYVCFVQNDKGEWLIVKAHK